LVVHISLASSIFLPDSQPSVTIEASFVPHGDLAGKSTGCARGAATAPFQERNIVKYSDALNFENLGRPVRAPRRNEEPSAWPDSLLH
jgi:hypothetical protein